MSAEPAAGQAPARAWALSWQTAALHLFALWGLVVVQPLLDVMAQKGEFFIALEVGGASLAIFVVLFTVLPPLVLLGLELLAGRLRPSLRIGVHLLFVVLLFVLGAIYALTDRFPKESWSLVFGGIGLGVAATFLYARVQFVRSLLSLLALAPVLFVVLFVFDSPARKVVFEPDLKPPPASAVAATPAAKRTPVVMLVIDEVPISSFMGPDGRIDAERFPNMARLAGGSTWFRNTAAAADFTIRAVPAILSGQRVRGDEVPLAADHRNNLFTLLARTHRLVVSEYATELCPPSLCRPTESTLERAKQLPAAFAAAIPKVLLPPGLNLKIPPLGLTFGEYDRVRDPRSTIDVERPRRGSWPSMAMPSSSASCGSPTGMPMGRARR
jgi:hypothetical protein